MISYKIYGERYNRYNIYIDDGEHTHSVFGGHTNGVNYYYKWACTHKNQLTNPDGRVRTRRIL